MSISSVRSHLVDLLRLHGSAWIEDVAEDDIHVSVHLVSVIF
jgi:hypothetical protein